MGDVANDQLTGGCVGPLDLGLGNGLRQVISDATGREDDETARRAISTALALLTGIAIAVVVTLLLAYPGVPWPALFNVDSPTAQTEAGPAAITLVVIFAIGLPLSVVGMAQSAYQSSSSPASGRSSPLSGLSSHFWLR